jgi:hypothetical protein
LEVVHAVSFVVISLLAVSTACFAQDTIRVSVEEVRIPVPSKTRTFDPTVQLNDLFVRTKGIAQPAVEQFRNIQYGKQSPGPCFRRRRYEG